MTASLLQLQQLFQRHLLSGDGGLAALVRPGGAISVQRRLQIYHRAYRARLVDALRDSFGHTLGYLGDDWFNHDALAFVEAHPSSHSSLNDYGAGFPGWLAAAHPQDTDIAELATLDWALRRAFDGPDAPVLGLAALGAMAAGDWQHIGFSLHPTCRRLQLQHNTLALWQAIDQDQAPPPSLRLAQPGDLLVWRLGQQPHFRSLGALEAAALDRLQQGLPFAALCDQLATLFPEADAAQQAGGLLWRWIDDGLLSTVLWPGR